MICCICQKEFEGYGNNPQPLDVKGECCGTCNMQYVIPARVFGVHTVTLPNKVKTNEKE